MCILNVHIPPIAFKARHLSEALKARHLSGSAFACLSQCARAGTGIVSPRFGIGCTYRLECTHKLSMFYCYSCCIAPKQKAEKAQTNKVDQEKR